MAAIYLEGDAYGAAPVPRVGVAVLICKNGQVLCGKRRSTVGYERWALPGGHLEFGETFEECACREVEEETGLLIQNVVLGTATSSVLLDELRPAHYVTIYMKAELVDFEAQAENLEPDKCSGWHWIDWPNIPEPIFKPLEELIGLKYDPFL